MGLFGLVIDLSNTSIPGVPYEAFVCNLLDLGVAVDHHHRP